MQYIILIITLVFESADSRLGRKLVIAKDISAHKKNRGSYV